MRCPICSQPADAVVLTYDAPPAGETVFDLGTQTYRREYVQCGLCAHLISRHELDLSALYSGEYMDTTYAGDRLRTTYERIMGLPPERSDNAGRAQRIVDALGAEGTVLDVGSGLAVFPARMQMLGWTPTALDPDARAVAHAHDTVGVAAVHADFLAAADLGRYDLVTLNKVLEHVEDPVAMLARTLDCLNEGGTVYVEVPDGERALLEGPGREELFIEHLHVFSMTSLCLLAQRCGLAVRSALRLREPSDKLTLVAFLEAA